ncbi:hypothetical protein P175DRAFT_0469887 [Aspergillus ochraceoroseus IBT 24754]|uniref:Rhodopsin domain-containing protein n=1 Tax=Aspergillus ochraceoroseus IBT 24754 TaxID=1392256 RepID=A0A2T5M6L5_9EURO|nr:uncharacterized protein P175DRAFT_0469887 [Aspergillus ochraceoroseus IBT 24754]PTU24174.1 hypothetical protein P175DRAFT_0469887 [Aspergillus ochraceoroseus IBT 24754]
MAGTLPPIFPVSETDHSGFVAVAAYTLLSLTVVTVFARLFTRWYIAKVIQPDDILLAGATGLAFLQTVFVQLAIDHGLGKKMSVVSSSDLSSFDKYAYTMQILLLASVTCSKLSIALLARSLTVDGYMLRGTQGLMAIIALWAMSSIPTLAIQCSLPRPWDPTGQCLNREALAGYIGAVNILTDAALVLLPCIVLHKVQISRWKRFRIMAMLATRLLVCVVTGVQIHYVNVAINSSDRTWASINSTIWNQIMMNFSIITTAIPSLGRLIVEMQPSLNAFAITERHGFSGDKYAISSLSGHFSRNHAMNDDLGTRSSVHGPLQSSKDGSESMQELVGDSIQQNMITKTVDFEIH